MRGESAKQGRTLLPWDLPAVSMGATYTLEVRRGQDTFLDILDRDWEEIVAERPPALEDRSDGRRYSRILRRSVRILKHVRSGTSFQPSELADSIFNEKYAEFVIIRREPPPRRTQRIKPDTIRGYINYLHALEFFKAEQKQLYSFDFRKPLADPQWAQTLSDSARKHLAELTGAEPKDVRERLEGVCNTLHEQKRVPTVAATVASFGIFGARAKLFRWSLTLYTEGDTSPFEIRHYPHLALRVRIRNR